ncbi:MAG: HAMP domain-containing protein [Myxococcales bacterium]|nr:HAMP domain-containing protein [Myxococcales bacterium]MCB9525847.1 HAMP domain-containing protein [Myxococcales bacterium]
MDQPARLNLVSGLYGRALLFVLLGGGALLGAVMVLAGQIVDSAAETLLDERTRLARTAGAFVEARLRQDLDRLTSALGEAACVPTSGGPGFDVLKCSARKAVFDGIYAADGDGRLLPEPALPTPLPEGADVGELVTRARRRGDVAVSHLVTGEGGAVLLLAAPVDHPEAGDAEFAIAVLRPLASHLLVPASASLGGVSLALVDSHGHMLASTGAVVAEGFHDHKAVLAHAVSEGREFRGRCHGCHTDDASAKLPVPEQTQVMAFAPLPGLELGLAVLEPEHLALAPALDWRRRLWQLAAALLILFVGFTGLAVRSIVRPVRLLTDAVHRSEANRVPLGVGRFGDDELGELARAFERWRSRMERTLNELEAQRAQLVAESDIVRAHLAGLQRISQHSADQLTLPEIIQIGLDQAVGLVPAGAGAMRVIPPDGQPVVGTQGLPPDRATDLLEAVATLPVNEFARVEGVFGGHIQLAGGLALAVALDGWPADLDQGRLWLASLIRQSGLCASHNLRLAAEGAQRAAQQKHLHAVLRAQEAERQRVARELHDTVAQDLAALRLEVERLSAREAHDPAALQALEARAGAMLDTVRRILLDLRPTILESLGFVSALEWLVERAQADHGVVARFIIDGDRPHAVRDEAATALFRVAQEAIQNAVRHGQAEHVFVTLGVTADALTLTIEDDGRGFEVGATGPEPSGRGFGLVGIRERALLLGGEARIIGAPEEGATVWVRVPRDGAEGDG